MAVKQRFPWVGVSAGAAFVVMVVAAVLRIPEHAGSSPGQALPVMVLTRIGSGASEELLAEQLAAYDPTPMFIPSSMNSSDPAAPAESRLGVSGPFAALPPDLTKKEILRFPSPVAIPVGSIEGLRLTERASAALAIGRIDEPGGALAVRGGHIEAVALSAGRVAVTLNLPASGDIPGDDWQPLELMGAVTSAGLVGELVVTSSSGSEEVDDFFRFHLRKNVRIDARLRPGFYAFRVGP